MSDLHKQLDLREMVDTAPLREKLMDVKNWEKTMKQREKELKLKNGAEVGLIVFGLPVILCLINRFVPRIVLTGYCPSCAYSQQNWNQREWQ